MNTSWLKNARHLLAVGLMMCAATHAAHAQNLEDIVSRHVQALGGADKLRAVKTLHIDAGTKVLLFMNINIRTLIADAQGVWSSVVINGDEKMRMIVTRQGGVTIESDEGKQKRTVMDAREAKGTFDDADLSGPFVDTQKKGISLKLLGEKKLPRVGSAYVIEVQRDAERTPSRYYIRTDNFLLARTESKTFSTEDKAWKDEWTDYDDYRTVSGIPLAHKMTTDDGELTVNSYKVNAPIESKIFEY